MLNNTPTEKIAISSMNYFNLKKLVSTVKDHQVDDAAAALAPI